MAKSEQFCVVVPTRNAPERCVVVARELAVAAREALFDYGLKIVFLINDSDLHISDHVEELLAAQDFFGAEVAVFRSDKNYPTVEESIRNNLSRGIDLLSERFIIIGNSDAVEFAALGRALSFMDARQIDLLLVGVENCELWQDKIVRRLYATPRLVHRPNLLSADASYGPDVFTRAFLDYGPVDYIAYIGCQIYTKKFFLAMCRVAMNEPLYSLPLASLAVAVCYEHMTGFYPEVVARRIDALTAGPNDPTYSPGWWVRDTRVSRGYSGNVGTSIVTGSLDLSERAFAALVSAQQVSIVRAESTYVFWNFLISMIDVIVRTVTNPPADAALRLTAKEGADFRSFGKRLEGVNLFMPEQDKARVCSWFQHFPSNENAPPVSSIKEWIEEMPAIVQAVQSRPGMGITVVKNAS